MLRVPQAELAPWTMAALTSPSMQNVARIFCRESAQPNKKYLKIPTSALGVSSVVSDSKGNLNWRVLKVTPPKALNFRSLSLARTLTWVDNQGWPENSETPPRWIPKDTNRRKQLRLSGEKEIPKTLQLIFLER